MIPALSITSAMDRNKTLGIRQVRRPATNPWTQMKMEVQIVQTFAFHRRRMVNIETCRTLYQVMNTKCRLHLTLKWPTPHEDILL